MKRQRLAATPMVAQASHFMMRTRPSMCVMASRVLLYLVSTGGSSAHAAVRSIARLDSFPSLFSGLRVVRIILSLQLPKQRPARLARKLIYVPHTLITDS